MVCIRRSGERSLDNNGHNCRQLYADARPVKTTTHSKRKRLKCKLCKHCEPTIWVWKICPRSSSTGYLLSFPSPTSSQLLWCAPGWPPSPPLRDCGNISTVMVLPSPSMGSNTTSGCCSYQGLRDFIYAHFTICVCMYTLCKECMVFYPNVVFIGLGGFVTSR